MFKVVSQLSYWVTTGQQLFHERPLDMKWYCVLLVEKYLNWKPFWLQTTISLGFWSQTLNIKENRKTWLDNNFVNNLPLCDLEKSFLLIIFQCNDAARHAEVMTNQFHFYVRKRRSQTDFQPCLSPVQSPGLLGRNNVMISEAITWRSGMVVWRYKK